MANSVYRINKGVNQSIEFKGLKAQYIWYLGFGVVLLMMLFVALFIAGVPSLICVGLIGIAGGFLVFKIYRMSARYGEHGMMKAIASKRIPKCVKVRSRGIFMKL